MPKPILTVEQKKYITSNYLKISASDMANDFGIGKGVVQRYLRKNNLIVPNDIKQQFKSIGINRMLDKKAHPFDDFIKEKYLITPVKTLADQIKKSHTYVKGRLKRLGLEIPADIIEQRKIDSRRKPGDVPKNKGLKQSDYMSPEIIERTLATRFKKGQTPHNAIGFKDGDIVTRHNHKDRNSQPYKWIRLGKGKWEMYHVNLWKQHYGIIPDGHIIVFKDKNTMNVVIGNLECITKKENMIRNSIHQYPEELKKTIQTLSIITRKINRHEKENH